MNFQADGYLFKPHEQPIMAGSPASPDHPARRRLAYLLIGLLLAATAGLQNGLLMAALPQLRGLLGLSPQEGGWIQVAYYMTYACMSILLFRVRQHYGLQRFVRLTLLLLLAGNLLQVVFESYLVELLARSASGIAASGLLVLAVFYLMQAFTGQAKLAGLALALGVMQFGTPLAQVWVPFLFAAGGMPAVFALQLALTLLCIGLVIRLPLPPAPTVRVMSWLDWFSFALFASGIALLCAFLVQGRIVWWTTSWLGYLLAGGIALTGTALLIEWRRSKPMLDLRWIGAPQILAFGLTGAVVRLLTSEQTVGAAGLMAGLGVGSRQMVAFYGVVLAATVFGLVLSLVRLDVNDIRRPVVVALLGIAVGAWLDMHSGVDTRPEQLYFSQALIAFSAMYFLGPMMLEGMIRALARGPNYIMSFSAVFGLSQTLGGLAGAALCTAFLTVRTRTHLADITPHLTLTDPNVALHLHGLARSLAPLSNDAAVLQQQAVGTLVQQAATQAMVMAYNDLFALIGLLAAAAFVCTGLLWLDRRRRGINLLADEIKRLESMLLPQK